MAACMLRASTFVCAPRRSWAPRCSGRHCRLARDSSSCPSLSGAGATARRARCLRACRSGWPACCRCTEKAATRWLQTLVSTRSWSPRWRGARSGLSSRTSIWRRASTRSRLSVSTRLTRSCRATRATSSLASRPSDARACTAPFRICAIRPARQTRHAHCLRPWSNLMRFGQRWRDGLVSTRTTSRGCRTATLRGSTARSQTLSRRSPKSIDGV